MTNNLSNVQVISCRWQDYSDELAQIRAQVFIEEQAVPEELEWDGEDADAWHFLALVDGIPAGTARLLASGQIGRMCVLRPFRRMGIGSRLLRKAEQQAAEALIAPLFLHAQTYIQNFYQQQGYRAQGEIFMDAGIPHIEMVKQTSG